MATIDDLARVAPPPAAPVGGAGNWREVETALSLRLPADYQALVGRYGRGHFDDIGLLTPFGPDDADQPDLVARAQELLDTYQDYSE